MAAATMMQRREHKVGTYDMLPYNLGNLKPIFLYSNYFNYHPNFSPHGPNETGRISAIANNGFSKM